MKGRLGKFGLLFLAVALCLAITGAGFAMWDKTLHIEGTVNTGEVDVEIMSVASDDPPPDGIVGDIYPGEGTIDVGKDKNVGATSVAIGEDNQSISVNVTNAYPCYETSVHFTAHNSGTVPVRLQDIIVTSPPEINVTGSDGIGEQIEPCEKRDNTIWFHVEQSAAELANYNFTVEFYYVQWNEYTPPGT